MKHLFRGMRGLVSCLLALALIMGAATAEQTADAPWAKLNPLMDAVAAAAFYAGGEEPLAVPDEAGTLDARFISAFLSFGQWIDAALGVTESTLRDVGAQQSYLQKVFSAQLPQLSAIETPEAINGYIGFHTTMTSQGDAGEMQCVGEVYWAEKPMRQMSGADYLAIQWQSPAVFNFRADSSALSGFRLTGFSIGTSLSLEMTMQQFFEKTLLEYYNSKYGYSVAYPAVFGDVVLTEAEEGFSASLPNGDADFSVKREANPSAMSLEDYTAKLAGDTGSGVYGINDEFHYGTVAYRTDAGRLVFTIFAVTKDSVYRAEFSYREELAQTYCAYAFYLENSFTVNAIGGIG